MKNLIHPLLEFRAKVLIVFENKSNAVNNNNPTDPTTTTMTMTTGTGIMFSNLKRELTKYHS